MMLTFTLAGQQLLVHQYRYCGTSNKSAAHAISCHILHHVLPRNCKAFCPSANTFLLSIPRHFKMFTCSTLWTSTRWAEWTERNTASTTETFPRENNNQRPQSYMSVDTCPHQPIRKCGDAAACNYWSSHLSPKKWCQSDHPVECKKWSSTTTVFSFIPLQVPP